MFRIGIGEFKNGHLKAENEILLKGGKIPLFLRNFGVFYQFFVNYGGF